MMAAGYTCLESSIEVAMVRFGAVFPQTEYEAQPEFVREFAEAVEGLGYDHILAYEHVLGVDPASPAASQGPYQLQHAFLSPFVLFAYMAAATTRLEFATGILILPQRQTALVAKQAATLDVLCGGRLRLGIGIGWNKGEYIALGQDFHDRGKRSAEQVELMRALWSQESVSFESSRHHFPQVGINPRPRRMIPVWFGGSADAVLRRAARLGDGWMTNYRKAEQAQPSLDKLHDYLAQAGRPPESFGLEARLRLADSSFAEMEGELRAWEGVGATHVSLNTMGCGFESPGEHLQALREFAERFIESSS
jgi:probable F420-dependent oxidoreductase